MLTKRLSNFLKGPRLEPFSSRWSLGYHLKSLSSFRVSCMRCTFVCVAFVTSASLLPILGTATDTPAPEACDAADRKASRRDLVPLPCRCSIYLGRRSSCGRGVSRSLAVGFGVLGRGSVAGVSPGCLLKWKKHRCMLVTAGNFQRLVRYPGVLNRNEANCNVTNQK